MKTCEHRDLPLNLHDNFYVDDEGNVRNKRKTNRTKQHDIAGTITKAGYRSIYFGFHYLAHRIAYYLHTGVDPKECQIDHINGNRLDNRKENLRIASCSQNQYNKTMLKNNKSGYKGVFWNTSQARWVGQLEKIINGKRRSFIVSTGKTAQEASEKLEALRPMYHGKFSNSGK